MTTQHRRFRFLVIGLFVLSAMALAPSAFARHHGYGVSVSGPGYSVGYSGCHHCGGYSHGSSYVSVGLYNNYAPAYYGPAYYYDYPSDYVVYERPVHRVRYYDRDRHYYHRDRHYRDRW